MSESKTLGQRLSPWITTFKCISITVGMPITMMLFIMGAEKMFFTTTCNIAGWKCEYGIGATDAMASYMGDLLDANKGMDIIAQPHKKK